jgi:hypothetical protein
MPGSVSAVLENPRNLRRWGLLVGIKLLDAVL